MIAYERCENEVGKLIGVLDSSLALAIIHDVGQPFWIRIGFKAR